MNYQDFIKAKQEVNTMADALEERTIELLKRFGLHKSHAERREIQFCADTVEVTYSDYDNHEWGTVSLPAYLLSADESALNDYAVALELQQAEAEKEAYRQRMAAEAKAEAARKESRRQLFRVLAEEFAGE